MFNARVERVGLVAWLCQIRQRDPWRVNHRFTSRRVNTLHTSPESLAVVDLKLDKRDRFGRLLRHVFEGKRNANLVVVKQGAASVWFEGDRGRCAKRLLRAARTA